VGEENVRVDSGGLRSHRDHSVAKRVDSIEEKGRAVEFESIELSERSVGNTARPMAGWPSCSKWKQSPVCVKYILPKSTRISPIQRPGSDRQGSRGIWERVREEAKTNQERWLSRFRLVSRSTLPKPGEASAIILWPFERPVLPRVPKQAFGPKGGIDGSNRALCMVHRLEP
jgi:hypothetical protein